MRYLIQQLIQQNILKTPLIIEAFRKIDRKDFVQPINKDEAYGNYPLPIGYGQTISQPLTVAFMLELLQPQPGDKILDVGAGSGWQTALLAYCVSQKTDEGKSRQEGANNSGKVYAVERIQELCDFGKANVAKLNYIQKGIAEFMCADGSKGLSDKAPFDKIIVAAAAEKVPEELKKQLKVGGRLVVPVGKDDQAIVRIDKVGEDKFKEERYPGFVFVPLITHK